MNIPLSKGGFTQSSRSENDDVICRTKKILIDSNLLPKTTKIYNYEFMIIIDPLQLTNELEKLNCRVPHMIREF